MSALNEALKAFGARDPKFISESENAVYQVTAQGGKAALRLHRVMYQTAETIWSELWWTKALAEARIPVPLPFKALNGDEVVTLASGQFATMVAWVQGQPFGEYNAPLAGSKVKQKALFWRIGRAIADMHNVTDTLTFPPNFTRHSWGRDGLVGENPFWGQFWENPSLTKPERAMVLRARAIAHDRLTVYLENGADFGLIHADVLRSNTYVDGDVVTLIDFDDCGFGFRIYELATLMSQNEGLDNTAELQAAAIAGYRGARPLSAEAEELLPMFLMLRRFVSMGWVVPRQKPGSQSVRLYADKAVKAARDFLGTG